MAQRRGRVICQQWLEIGQILTQDRDLAQSKLFSVAEMMVIHAAWLDAARFLNRGIDTEALDEAMESITRVRPGGHYLADALTLKMLRTDEFFGNELFDHSESCSPHQSLLKRAHQKVGALVAGFESPAPDKVQEGLRRHFYDACKCLEQS